MRKQLTTTADVVEALGGTRAVAALTGRKLPAASNWKGFQTFPPDTFIVMKEELDRLGYEAPASLWRMVASQPERVGAG